MSNFDENEIETEIVPFLLPTSRPDLRAIAVRYFLGLTGTEQGRKFISKKPRYVELIADLIDDGNADITKDVCKIIVNLAGDIDIACMLSNNKRICHLLKSVFSDSTTESSIAEMALANLSRSEQSARKIVDFIVHEEDLNLIVPKAIDMLCKNGQKHEHLASFLSNLAQDSRVRRLLLNKDNCLLSQLLPCIGFKESVTVRTGVTAAVRNCCFETDCHELLLSDQIDILPRLLYPLAGPEEFDDEDNEGLPVDLQYLEPDKTREPDAGIRCMLVEALNQLCAQKVCRQFIIKKNAYIIMRELHKWETNSSNLVAIENLISVLISDEPEPGMENLNEVDIPENILAKLAVESDSP